MKKVTLTNIQKYELCIYASNNKKSRGEYVDWVEQKWDVRIHESTIIWILQGQNKWLTSEVIHPEQKWHKPVTFSELELAFKEFVLSYQHWAILSDAILTEKAKLLASGLGIPENTLQFSSG